MAEPIAVSSLKATFRFPVQSSDWKNRFLVGAALSLAGALIPIVPALFVNGYLLEVVRRTIRGEEPALPARDDWGKPARHGVQLLLFSLVHYLPGLLVILAGAGLYSAVVFAFPLSQLWAGSSEELSGVFPLVFLGILAVFMVCIVAGSALMLLASILLRWRWGHYADHDLFGAALRLREVRQFLWRNKLAGSSPG